jgi:hypothetical protein
MPAAQCAAVSEERAAPGEKRAASRKKRRKPEKRDTMATSDESKSAEQGSNSNAEQGSNSNAEQGSSSAAQGSNSSAEQGSSSAEQGSSSAEQGSSSAELSSEVTREAQVIAAGGTLPPGDTAAAAGGADAEGASPAPKKAPGSVLDAVRNAVMAMNDLKQDIEAIAVSAELSVQNAIAISGQSDTDMAKVLGACSE